MCFVGNLPGEVREREIEDLFYKVTALLGRHPPELELLRSCGVREMHVPSSRPAPSPDPAGYVLGLLAKGGTSQEMVPTNKVGFCAVPAVWPHPEHRPEAATQAASLRLCGVREPTVRMPSTLEQWRC